MLIVDIISVKTGNLSRVFVKSAEVSHTAGTAVVTLEKAVADSALKQAVVDQGYTVTGIE